MKKSISALLVLTMCFCLFGLTGCGEKAADVENPYADLDMTEYVTLPDYDKYTTSEPQVEEVSEEEVETEISARLEEAATTESVKEGTVEKGDKVKITYHGTLSDGSTKDGLNNEQGYEMTLGSANMIDGFQEGLYGAKIGETVTLNLQFPDPYSPDEELSGQPVTFKVKVISKEVEVVPELDEEFVKANSDAKTVEEYRQSVKDDLEKEEYDSQLTDLKQEIFNQISEETEVLKYPEERVNAKAEELDSDYRNYAQQYGYAEDEWEKFLDDCFKMDQEEFDEQVKLAAQNEVKNEMIVYAIAAKEKITLTQKEYQQALDDLLDSTGLDAETFESYVGMTVEEYAKQYNMGVNVLLTKELDTIYDRLEKK